MNSTEINRQTNIKNDRCDSILPTDGEGEQLGGEFPMPTGCDSELQAVLMAWHSATVRLEQTHHALREEVKRLTDELESKNRQLAKKNRLADLGRMAAHVAHEVRNNLVPVTLYLSLLERRLEPDDTSRQLLDKVTAGFAELQSTVTDLLYFTSDSGPAMTRFSLRDAIDEVIVSLSEQLVAQEISTEISVPTEATILADADMFRRAILHLVRNAIDSMSGGGALAVTVRNEGQETWIEIGDTGEGLFDPDVDDAFEPFVEPRRGGTGLELAIVQRITEVHGGHAAAVARPEGGAIMTICIPNDIPEPHEIKTSTHRNDVIEESTENEEAA